MSKLVLFDGLVAQLKTLKSLKGVRLWNNQPANESQENSFLYPCVFIEFMPSEYQQKGNAVQQYQMVVRLHICFESYKDQDTSILTLVDDVFKKTHYQQFGDFAKLKRINEEQNFDHNNVQDYMQDYQTQGQDDLVDSRPTTEATPVDPVVTADIKLKVDDL